MTQYVVNQLLLVTASLCFILKQSNCMQFPIFVLKYLGLWSTFKVSFTTKTNLSNDAKYFGKQSNKDFIYIFQKIWYKTSTQT